MMEQSTAESNMFPVGSGASQHWIFNPYLLLVMRLVLAAVFIYAAAQKIGHPLQFADEIRMYRILDIGPPLYIASVVLPWIERHFARNRPLPARLRAHSHCVQRRISDRRLYQDGSGDERGEHCLHEGVLRLRLRLRGNVCVEKTP
jgi:hypothetical protein